MGLLYPYLYFPVTGENFPGQEVDWASRISEVNFNGNKADSPTHKNEKGNRT
jgi:hypothetical protein